ncbi:MAG: Crp/Fnr family transcriptional regulator [Saprospiraceae bacterium]|nr:Crp/Fnr family transcriptional regulator [Saprospiraceae bacterium]
MTQKEIHAYIELFFEGLKAWRIDEAVLAHIKEQIRIQPVPSNRVLLAPGKVCTQVYFVVEGCFVCRYINEHEGTAKTINFYANDLHPFMACIDSYFSQTPTRCELRAVSDATVVSFPKQALDQLLETDEALRRFYYSVVIQALTEENDLKLKLIAYSSAELYRYIVQELPMVIQKVPAKYIAEFMGISAEWLSKLKKGAKRR